MISLYASNPLNATVRITSSPNIVDSTNQDQGAASLSSLLEKQYQLVAEEKRAAQKVVGVSLTTIGACIIELLFAIGKAPSSLLSFIYGVTTLAETLCELVFLRSSASYINRLQGLKHTLKEMQSQDPQKLSPAQRGLIEGGKEALEAQLIQPSDPKTTKVIARLQTLMAGVIGLVLGMSILKKGHNPLKFLENPLSKGINNFLDKTWDRLGLKSEWQQNIAQSVLLTLPMLYTWKAKQALVPSINLNNPYMHQLQGGATAQKVCTFESLLQSLPAIHVAGGLTLAQVAEMPYGVWAMWELLRSSKEMRQACSSC